MSKYHVNSKTGDPGLCRAEQGGCPFGGDESHFETPELARVAFEASQGGSFMRRARGFAKRMLMVGGMGVTAVAIAGCTSISAPPEYGPEIGPVETPDEPVATQEADPSWVDKANELVEDHPLSTPSEQEIEDWLNEKKEKLEGWANEYGAGSESAPLSYETDGIYFQGKSLNVSPEEVAEAKTTLKSLVEKAEYDDGGYNRAEQFGRGFKSQIAGHVEHRDVPDATFRNDTPQARVVSGSFIDPYTGEPVEVIGGAQADADIDHIVPLKEAYVSGANGWDLEQGKEFANDMNNLVYTASAVNRGKSDKDAAEWLPSYEPSQCIYAVKQIEIKGQYKLSVDSAEKSALQEIINTKCDS